MGLDNKIYERQWIPSYYLNYGSITDTSPNGEGVYSGDVLIHQVPGHFGLVSVGSLAGAIQDVYPPMAQQLFQENRGTWRNANQITDPRTVALWYGAAAIPGVIHSWAPLSTAGMEAWQSFEFAFPGATADIVQMLTPPTSIPATIPGLAVFDAEQIYDLYKEQY